MQAFYLEHAKYCLIPACLEKFQAFVWIPKPYEINPADVSPVIAMTNPLCERNEHEKQKEHQSHLHEEKKK